MSDQGIELPAVGSKWRNIYTRRIVTVTRAGETPPEYVVRRVGIWTDESGLSSHFWKPENWYACHHPYNEELQ